MSDIAAPRGRPHDDDARKVFSWLAAHALRGAAHSVLTPLTMLSVETEGQPLTPDQRDLVNTARSAAIQLKQLGEDIETLTHAAAHTLESHPKRIALTTLLREAVAQAQTPTPPDPPRDIVTRVSPTLPQVWCDHAQTRRALAAIIENALRFSPPDTPISVEARKRGDWAIIRVRDAGPGPAPTEVERIFEPLYSGERRHDDCGVGRGIGLGLAVARVCIEAQGGRIALEPVDGSGATFTVELPLTQPRTTSASD